MVNTYYLDKDDAIMHVLKKEGVVTLFNYLDAKQLSRLYLKTSMIRKKKVMQGIYSESSFNMHERYLEKLLKGKIKWTLMIFSKGDYIIRNDENKLKKGTYILFDPEDWDDKAGGFVVFIDKEGNQIRPPSRKNTLTIIKNPESFYTKYVNSLAKKKRKILLGITS